MPYGPIVIAEHGTPQPYRYVVVDGDIRADDVPNIDIQRGWPHFI